MLDDSPETAVARLTRLADAAVAVLDRLEVLAVARFGPAADLELAVEDLRAHLVEFDRISPRQTGVTIAELVDESGGGPDAALAASLAAALRGSVNSIRQRSASLSLELGHLVADTQHVVSSTAGGAGTYDGTGRTAVGPIRRGRGLG
jgi:hypothetical protein